MTDYHINIFFSDEDGGYIADIPDLEACSAFGATLAGFGFDRSQFAPAFNHRRVEDRNRSGQRGDGRRDKNRDDDFSRKGAICGGRSGGRRRFNVLSGHGALHSCPKIARAVRVPARAAIQNGRTP